MATIGLDKPHYSKITKGENDVETYGTPAVLAKAISANINIKTASGDLFADDGTAESFDEFVDGTLSLNVNDLASSVLVDLLGMRIDKNGVVVSSAQDISNEVAIAFRARKANGKYRYFWLLRVKFRVPSSAFTTKSNSITFNTPTIEGKIMRQNKVDSMGRNNWKQEITEGDTGVSKTTIDNWFNEVYEPDFSAVGGE